jgi:antitoxin VapB
MPGKRTTSLNIKNKKTLQLAQQLARLTGESMTVAVSNAIRERLERVRTDGLAERILRIGKECAAHFKEPYKSIDHGELLYDENGLPK